MSHITANLYTAHIPRREPTPGEIWYDEQVQMGKRRAEVLKQKMGWGLCAKFPVEALEAE